MTAAELKAIADRCEAATSEGWVCADVPPLEINGEMSQWCEVYRDKPDAVILSIDASTNENYLADGEFVAHARTDVPALLKYIAELEQALSGRTVSCARCEALARVEQWRPIAEIRGDLGECVLVNLSDPGQTKVGSSSDLRFAMDQWTHFIPVPALTTEEAERLLAEMKAGGE